jgi:hypothetical protein
MEEQVESLLVLPYTALVLLVIAFPELEVPKKKHGMRLLAWGRDMLGSHASTW